MCHLCEWRKDKLQAFCNTASLMGKNRIIIGPGKILAIYLFHPLAAQYFSLTAAECLGQLYKMLSKYSELDQFNEMPGRVYFEELVMHIDCSKNPSIAIGQCLPTPHYLI